MTSSLVPPLSRAATSTFEELALLFASDTLTEEQEAAVASTTVRVRFRGPLSGALELRVTDALLPQIAANMLGFMDEPPAQLQQDAMGELANVICGNVLPDVAGPSAVFDLEAPAAVTAPLPGQPTAFARVGLEDSGCAEVSLYLDVA